MAVDGRARDAQVVKPSPNGAGLTDTLPVAEAVALLLGRVHNAGRVALGLHAFEVATLKQPVNQ